MAKKVDGFEEPNYTQTPNKLFDEVMKEIETMAELKVTLAIIRQTAGWHRRYVTFGIGKIERLTGLARNSVVSGTEAAEARGTIRRIPTEGEARWELVINDTPSTAEGAEIEGGSTAEGMTPQDLTKNPSTAEGLKRKKETVKQITEAANKTVDYILETQKKVKYQNRDKIPEPYLPFADLYNELTKQEPTKRVIFDWMGTFEDWKQEGLQPEHIRAAWNYAIRPEGGFPVGRPGALTNTAVAMKTRATTRPQRTHVEEFDPYAALTEMLQGGAS